MPVKSPKDNIPTVINPKNLRKYLKTILGFRPKNLIYYKIALIHRSATHQLLNGKNINNERLEYLGDAIIEAILSDFLFHKYEDALEGFLTKVRSKIVSRANLNYIAEECGLTKLLVYTSILPQNSRRIYGDAFEAFIGAVFLDKGYEKTYTFLIDRIITKYIDLESAIANETDYISMIYEWSQKNKAKISVSFNESFNYNENKPIFTSDISVNGEKYGTGSGISKKLAEKEAAKQAWEKLK